MNRINQIVEANNQYSGHGWAFEHTKKYVCSVADEEVEAGVFQHYNDQNHSNLIKTVIELPSSYGCAIKCKYCATAGINSVRLLYVKELNELLSFLMTDTPFDFFKPVVISFTGSGDYSKTNKTVNEFCSQIHASDPRFLFTFSSSAWTAELLELVDAQTFADRVMRIQITYISLDDEMVSQVIPSTNSIAKKINSIIAYIMSSDQQHYRVNYLLIQKVNDQAEHFQQFIHAWKMVRNKICVRISMLNKTNSARQNELNPTSLRNAEKLNSLLREEGFNSYLYYSFYDDRLNCGQLLTEPALPRNLLQSFCSR
jgi:adenine C2-methylase RlmN of 23S rRNA A2503 and tRNA A37